MSPASSRRSSTSATCGTGGWATAAMWSSPTSRKARAAFAISTRSSGSANMPIGCARWPSWSRSACSRPRNCASSTSAERFLWAVRCHLHLAAGRAEERLTFDYQREIAARMNYANRPGKSPVERFMRHYFLHAKTVGDLTGVFLAHLDEKFARRGRRIGLPAFRRRPGKLEGFMLDRGRLAIPDDDFLSQDPGAADPDVRARRPSRPRNPSAGDARRRPLRQADRRRMSAPIRERTLCSSTC